MNDQERDELFAALAQLNRRHGPAPKGPAAVSAAPAAPLPPDVQIKEMPR